MRGCVWVHMGRPRKNKSSSKPAPAGTTTLEHFFAPATAEEVQQQQQQQQRVQEEEEEEKQQQEPPQKKPRKQAPPVRTGKGYVKLCDRVSEDGLPLLRKSVKSAIILTLVKKSALFPTHFTTPLLPLLHT